MTDVIISIGSEELETCCRAVGTANSVLKHVRAGDKTAYLAALGALTAEWFSINSSLPEYPQEFQDYFGVLDQAFKELRSEASEISRNDFALRFGKLYREVDNGLLPELGQWTEMLLRGMVALRAREAGKP